MEKKYFVCADTVSIKDYVRPVGIMFNKILVSFDEEPLVTYTSNYEFMPEFFEHVRFYELYFNDRGIPIKLHHLDGQKEDKEFPNGWVDYTSYMEGLPHNQRFLYNEMDSYFGTNSELYCALIEWGKTIANKKISNYMHKE